MTPRQAVILAAGTGSRLGTLTCQRPKCLLEVGGQALIQHQIDALRGAGIERIAVIAGYRAELLAPVLDDRVELVINRRFAETNSLYSLHLARDVVTGPFLLVNGDLLAHPEIYRRVAATEGPAFAYDSTSGTHEEHMKVVLDGDRLRAIGKSIPAASSHGENLGVLHFARASVAPLFALAGALIEAGGERDWAPAAVDELARQVTVRGLDVRDLPWTEIDFPDDLVQAERRIWPAIRASLGPVDERRRRRTATPPWLPALGLGGFDEVTGVG